MCLLVSGMKTIAINLPELVRSDPYGQREFALTAGPVCKRSDPTDRDGRRCNVNNNNNPATFRNWDRI